MLSKYFENNYCCGIELKNFYLNFWYLKCFFVLEFIFVFFIFVGNLKLLKGDINEYVFYIIRVEKEKLEVLDLKED